jgi:hypothetical protein
MQLVPVVKEDAPSSAEISHGPADYYTPPPLYEPIRGTIALEHGLLNNVMSGFVCMDSSENTYGDVVVIDSMRLWN